MSKKITMSLLLIIMSMTILSVSVIFGNKEEVKHNLKIIYEGDLVFNEYIEEDKNVVIKSPDEQKNIDSISLNKSEKITIDKVDLPEDKIISHWKRTSDKKEDTIKPVLVDKKDFTVSFLIDSGNLKNGKVTSPKINKSVEKNKNLNDIVPEVELSKEHSALGWFTIEEKEEEIEVEEKDDKKDDKKDKKKKKKIEKKIVQEYKKLDLKNEINIQEDLNVYAITYPDINNNNIDDRKEEINLKVNFNLNNEIVEHKLHVGQPFKLKTPQNKEHIFLGWFTDPNFKNEFNEKTLLKDTEVFAKWKKPKDYVESKELITNEEVSNRVESYLEERNRDIYNQARKEVELQEKKQEAKKKEQNTNISNERFVFKNYNKQQLYNIKFYDNEKFLFSVSLPYGNTIELLDNEENKLKEYSIRQNVSINLNGLLNISEDQLFDSKTVTKNNTNVLQIYPKNNKEEMN